MARSGFTIIEVIVAASLLAVALTVLWGIALSFGDTAEVQEARIRALDEARRAVSVLTRELAQSAAATLTPLPAGSVSYRIAADLDGNGTALDVHGNLELSPVRTIRRDTEDANKDGFTETQLVLIDGDKVRVLANGLVPDEDASANDTPTRGIWFETCDAGIRAAIRTQARSERRHHVLKAHLTAIITPRN